MYKNYIKIWTYHQPLTLLKFKKHKLQVSNTNMLNPDTVHSDNSNADGEGEKKKGTTVDNSNHPIDEKKAVVER